MVWLRSSLEALGWLLLALGGAWLALVVPVHFRAVAESVLSAAGDGTQTVSDLRQEDLRAGRWGPVELLEGIAVGPLDPNLRGQLDRLRAENPTIAVLGGPDAFLEAWWQSLSPTDDAIPADIASQVLPRPHRHALRERLASSVNLTVREILNTRQLTGYTEFLPVNTPAGGPLETAILLAATLEETRAWSPAASTELGQLATAANQGDLRALARLEGLYAALISSARQMDAQSLRLWVSASPDLATFAGLSGLAQVDFVALPDLFAAIRLSDDAPGVSGYLRRQREDGGATLSTALSYGSGAVRYMLAQTQPLYEPPGWLGRLPTSVGAAETTFATLVYGQPRIGLLLKLIGLFALGFGLAMALVRLVELAHGRPRAPVRARAIWLSQAALAVTLGGVFGLFLEPNLLVLPPESPGSELRFNLASLVPLGASGAPDFSAMIDQVTLLILLIFAIVQFMIFGLCLVKLTEIKRQAVSPATRLRLLDNEENLFDLGLYVGLGGTVSSLILVVLDLVSASLMAAYASTLFGIIFVATLKVFFLRPLRRQLVLADANEPNGNA